MKVLSIICFVAIILFSSNIDAQHRLGSRLNPEDCECTYMVPGFFGHQVFKEGKRVKRPELLQLYKPMPSVLREYNRGHKQRNVGNIMLGASLVGVIGVAAATKDKYWEDYSTLEKGGIYGSFAALIGGAVLAVSGDKKVVWAYKDYAVATKDAEDTYVIYGDNVFLPNRTRLKKNQVRDIMSTYPDALKKYNRSITSRTIGAVGMLGSFGGLIALAANSSNQGDWDDIPSLSKVGIIGTTAGFIVGSGFFVASSVQRENSYLSMSYECDCLVRNQPVRNERTSYWALGMNDNGVGLVFGF